MTILKRVAFILLMLSCAVMFTMLGIIGAEMNSPSVELVCLAGELLAAFGSIYALVMEV